MHNLLRYHEDGEGKLGDFSHFEIDYHPEFKTTKCFHVVRKDGSKQDFSFKKIVANLTGQFVPLSKK
jgi:hypothetical protein